MSDNPISKKTQRLSRDQIEQGAFILRQGGLLALPTETVYGLGADARQTKSIEAIYAAKQRPHFNPLIVHLSDLKTAQKYGHFDDLSLALAQKFWPGPLTLVLPLRAGHGLSESVTAGLSTVALRVPAAPLARKLLGVFDGPIAAPSANQSGFISPTTADHVLWTLDGKIDAVLDGGPCALGIESTIIALRDQRAYLLRAGGLPKEAIEDTLNQPIHHDMTPDQPSAPGQMLRHYATKTRLRINRHKPDINSIYIGFGQTDGDLNLSVRGDLNEAGANLFAILHHADELARQRGADQICVAPIPQRDLGLALNDRLRRASNGS